MTSSRKASGDKGHHIPPLVGWWFGGASTGREIAISLLWRIGGILAIVISFSLFGLNGLATLMILSVVGVWIYVWRKVRDRT